ncbi:hypothetical protein AWW71_29450, partial [Bacillus cereus]
MRWNRFDLAVGLGPVGAGSFGRDVQFGAGVATCVGDVGAAVVGEHPFDGDAAFGEPGDRALQDPDRGDGFLIGADRGVGEPGVVVDDGVHEPGPESWFGVLAPSRVGGGDPVGAALGDAHEPVPAAVRDIAEFGHVDVDQRTRIGVFVATDRLSGGTIQVGKPVQPASHQHRVDRRGRQREFVADLDRPQPVPQPPPHDLARQFQRGLGRARVRTARPIGHRGHT